ncbi:MAG: hypothetical protein F4Z86_15040 [Gemmatimonadetes bacterium]|nr:hypothetical protein [Gemmatimonadota bacterium]MYB58038.1 hypothetical protein [Gemmatimonadota bacterium]
MHDIFGSGGTEFVPPVLVFYADKERVALAVYRFAQVIGELWLHEEPAFDFAAKFVGLRTDVFCMTEETEGLAVGPEGCPPIDVEYKAVARCGRAAVRCAAAGVDQGGQGRC